MLLLKARVLALTYIEGIPVIVEAVLVLNVRLGIMRADTITSKLFRRILSLGVNTGFIA